MNIIYFFILSSAEIVKRSLAEKQVEELKAVESSSSHQKADVEEMMEGELQCVICNELFITVSILCPRLEAE